MSTDYTYLLEMRGATKEFEGVKAIESIDLWGRRGECVDLCGENGAGKSTLMTVLSVVYQSGTWEGGMPWEGNRLKAHSIRAYDVAANSKAVTSFLASDNVQGGRIAAGRTPLGGN